jgi:hypothetical protein
MVYEASRTKAVVLASRDLVHFENEHPGENAGPKSDFCFLDHISQYMLVKFWPLWKDVSSALFLIRRDGTNHPEAAVVHAPLSTFKSLRSISRGSAEASLSALSSRTAVVSMAVSDLFPRSFRRCLPFWPDHANDEYVDR